MSPIQPLMILEKGKAKFFGESSDLTEIKYSPVCVTAFFPWELLQDITRKLHEKK
jgi:hypothetical protein